MRDPDTGLPYPKLQVYVAPQVPYLVHLASTSAGYRHATLWLRDRLARLLDEELAGHEDHESYAELMADMPPGWRDRPGFIVLDNNGDGDSGQSG